MKYLNNIIIIIILGITFTSCKNDPTDELIPEVVTEVTDKVEGNWILDELNLKSELEDPTTGLVVNVVGENNNSTLNIDFDGQGNAYISGDMNMRMTVSVDGIKILEEQMTESFDENDTYEIDSDGILSFEDDADSAFETAILENGKLRLDFGNFDFEGMDDLLLSGFEMKFDMIFVKN